MTSRLRKFRNLFSVALPLALCLFLAACGNDQPDNLLTEEQMIPVLKDLHIAYAGVDLTISDLKEREQRYAEVSQVVLSKHQLDKQVFDESYTYYQRHPMLMDTIYIRVIDQLNEEMTQMSHKPPPDPQNPNTGGLLNLKPGGDQAPK